MKTTITCLIVALFWNIAATQQLSIYTENIAKEAAADEKRPNDIYLANGVSGHWATVARFNKRDPAAKGFDPSYTVIFAKFKPVVTKIRDGYYQITFTSEIAENLP
jgi:hypothetical protein